MRPILVIVAAALVACGPQKTCTLVGCESGTILTLVPSSGASLTPGSYSVNVAGIGIDACTINADGSINMTGCNTGNPSLAESGAALKFFFPTGTMSTPASMITVTVTNDGNQIYGMTIPESSREIFPNGSDCPGTCSQADVTVMVQ